MLPFESVPGSEEHLAVSTRRPSTLRQGQSLTLVSRSTKRHPIHLWGKVPPGASLHREAVEPLTGPQRQLLAARCQS